MSASGVSRASSGKRASFMDPTSSSAVKEREKVTPSRQPSNRSNVSVVPTTAGGSSPRTDNAKTIESFLQDARNAVGIGSPGAGSPGFSPRVGSRAQSPSSPGPRGARSRSVSPGRAERTPNRAASSTTLRWNAPLPGDTRDSARTNAPGGSPGTPAVFSAGYLGADAFVGGFGAFGSYAGGAADAISDARLNTHTPAHALSRAHHARFDVSLDPALRFGVKNLGGNPAVATSILPTYGGMGGGGFSGAAFGDVFSRERAASVTAFREAALMRDQIRVEGTRGVGVEDSVAKTEIARLESVVNELASEVRAFTLGAKKNDLLETEFETDPENVPPGALSPEARAFASGSPSLASPSGTPLGRSSRNSSRDSLLSPPRNRGSANDLIRAATRNASREKLFSEAGAETTSVRSAGGSGTGVFKDSDKDSDTARSVEADADLRRSKADVAGRYLRTTRRDIEAARYARGLKTHSGSAAEQFWGEGRGPVLGGGAVGGGIDGADDDGVEDVDLVARDLKQRRDEDRRRRNEDIASGTRRGDGVDNSEDALKQFGGGFGDDAAAAFAAALSAIDARRAARPDPAVEITRLKERNRALRRELGVAQRLMTGYHAQLMTGGMTESFATAKKAAYQYQTGSFSNPPPSFAARRFSRRPFAAPVTMQFQSGPREPVKGLSSTRRAESKRTAAELAVLRAERAFAETAAEVDEYNAYEADVFATEKSARGDDTASIARELAALKETVTGLVGRMDNDMERERERAANPRTDERSDAATRSPTGSSLGSRLETPNAETLSSRDGDANLEIPSPNRGPTSLTRSPASEISFGVLRDEHLRERSEANDFDSEKVAKETSPGMSLETDTVFLRTPAKKNESPGGEVESERVDTPTGSVS